MWVDYWGVGGGGGKGYVAPLQIIGGLAPCAPPPPCYYAYAFRLTVFSYSRYGIKGRFRGDVV